MIIGNGLIATSLQNIDSENVLFFASGVSNSLETRNSEFEREFTLLKENLGKYSNAQFVYFSTLSINDQSKQDSHYVLHKIRIEEYIKNNSDNYLIVRVGNVVGKGGNANTLFNYLKNQISNQNPFVLHKKARRLLIDIDDISGFLSAKIPVLNNQTVNLSFPYYYDLNEIIGAIEKETESEAIYEEVDEGDFYQVDFEDHVNHFFSEVKPQNYLKTLAKKYI